MENFKDLPLDVRLSAYIDGQVSPEEARELESILASDAEARDLLEQLNAGSAFGNEMFAEMLREPVPLNLVRAIKTPATSGGGAAPKAANSNIVSFFRFVPQAIAASAVLLIAGGYTGYFLGARTANMPVEISETSAFEAPGAGEAKTRGMGNLTFDAAAPAEEQVKSISVGKADIALMEVANLHKAYAANKTHAGEVPAAQESELIGWLEATTSVKFAVPDLSADGYRFRGGTIGFAVGQPTGALFYENDAGALVAVYFMKNVDMAGAAPGQDGFAVIGGQKDATSYFIAAPDVALAYKIEDKVKTAF